ncbi:peptidoglycan recognition protein [Streptomyces sp. CB03911]|uniref:peptidoglycan recognition protein family protein n=1 Tax=Streptomyces sp. CB03911 TaxID=1804758 RepID=UPI0009A10DCC|nr:peptidoglycan recognition protein [Streptomyces sp. CB03911]
MDIDRRSVLRRAAQAASAGAAVALAAAGPPRHPRHPAGLRPAAAPVPAPPPGGRTAFAAAAPPVIVRRSTWQTNEPETERKRDPAVRAVFIHHTDDPNSYGPQDVPDILRAIYREHRENQGWDDIGYNFLVDRFGTVYEGRLGSTEEPVVGAHTMGFNRETVGIAAIGTYTAGIEVPAPVLDAMARIAAWKLGRYGIDPRGRSELTSESSGSRFPSGTSHGFDAVSGHRDAFCTLCPGDALYLALPRITERAAEILRGGPSGRPGAATAPPRPFRQPSELVRELSPRT